MNTDIWLWFLALVIIVVGLIGTVAPALPGIAFVYAGLWLGAWVDHYQYVGFWTLLALGVLTALAMLGDFLASSVGVKKAGASKHAFWGTTIGSIVGMFFGLPGLFFGPMIGARVGEYYAHQNAYKAGKISLVALMGMVIGIAVKLAIAVLMVGVLLWHNCGDLYNFSLFFAQTAYLLAIDCVFFVLVLIVTIYENIFLIKNYFIVEANIHVCHH